MLKLRPVTHVTTRATYWTFRQAFSATASWGLRSKASVPAPDFAHLKLHNRSIAVCGQALQ